MVKYYGTGADSRVTFSTLFSNPDTDGDDCGSVYGDTALIIGQSELTAGFDAGYVGLPFNIDTSSAPGLACGGSTHNGTDPYMLDLTFTGYTQPTIHDIHPHICIPKPGTSPPRCYDPQTDGVAGNYGSATARNLYGIPNDNNHGGIWLFLFNHSLTSHKVILGETNHVQAQGSFCAGYDKSMAFSNVNGFNGYNGTSSSLYQNAAANTVFRPWENDLDSCHAMPEDIAPPYSP